MNWKVNYLPDAAKDFKKLSKNQQIQVIKAIDKVSSNLLPSQEGGYGKVLGNKQGMNLSGFLKIKLKNAGIRIVYKAVRTDSEMLIIVIGMRTDEQVYHEAKHRIEKYDL
ncbi:MAG: type II toxin-antitoxin system RelE/ParE family toxin [Eubacterium sp.]|nr:type II toxin-antitoxin system RelE/ParE family toxin [Eubacterium sp.]